MRAEYSFNERQPDGSYIERPLAELPDERRIIMARQFPDGVEAARVAVSNGVKVEITPFNHLEVWCSVSYPCLPEETVGAFRQAWLDVQRELSAKITELKLDVNKATQLDRVAAARAATMSDPLKKQRW